MSKVEKVFELLEVAAYEEVYLFDSKERYRITDKLEVQHKLEDNTWEACEIQISDLLQEDCITKIPKSKLELLHDEMMASLQEDYAYLDCEGTMGQLELMSTDYRYGLCTQGNTGTQAEMEFIREKREVESEIRFLQKKYPDNEWNGVSIHYFISYDIHRKKLGIVSSYNNINSAYYMPSKDTCIELLNTIGENRYKKYILNI